MHRRHRIDFAGEKREGKERKKMEWIRIHKCWYATSSWVPIFFILWESLQHTEVSKCHETKTYFQRFYTPNSLWHENASEFSRDKMDQSLNAWHISIPKWCDFDRISKIYDAIDTNDRHRHRLPLRREKNRTSTYCRIRLKTMQAERKNPLAFCKHWQPAPCCRFQSIKLITALS